MSSSEGENEFDGGGETEEKPDAEGGGGEEEEEEEDDDDDDDDDDDEEEEQEEDAPLSCLKKETAGERPSRRKRKAVDYTDVGGDDGEDEEVEAEEDNDSDDDDDVPLSSLKKSPRKPSKSRPNPKALSLSGKKNALKPEGSKSPSKVSTSSKSNDYASASAALYDSGSKKGVLIQKLLCRWWYAVTWPEPTKLPDSPPMNYDELNGFEGVYICTSGEKVGHILDMRNKDTCPSFEHYAKKTSKELQEMLLRALTEQKRQLIEVEAEGTPTEKGINADIKLVKSIKPDEADKEATKVLKAAKMKL